MAKRSPTASGRHCNHGASALGSWLKSGQICQLKMCWRRLSSVAGKPCTSSGRVRAAPTESTSSDEAFWQAVLASPDLRHLLIECAFPDEESRLAGQARHYSPSRLAADLAQLPAQVQVWISHLKPTDAERTLAQIAALAPCEVQALAAGVVLTV